MWEIEEICFLIAERKSQNSKYHQTFKKLRFWLSVAKRLNRHFNTSYTSNQCKGKLQQLIKEYNLMRLYCTGNGSQSTLLSWLFFEEFRTLFWLRPSDRNNYECELNMSHNHQQRQPYFSELISQPPSPSPFSNEGKSKSKCHGLIYIVV
ncbi:20936_t:CDS:2 [Dentiscutata erythropus]|uniref:20936_t:CDS:1 n=1 Tax=Dentiscutata erythropus TaxID=1348616 RepID=A0A9N9EAV8_9GLOM|nr:20936_t:CDS:2 [Dentiscutata erythropus]